ncbi:MAG: FAD-binding protein [Pseudomonadota bacterium]|nr:FAD-binding protein [Pseudomonadota bacterium]
MKYQSWGRHPRFIQEGIQLNWRKQSLPDPINGTKTLLPFGNGRSYGDVCLNRGGTVLDVRRLNRFISFDQDNGVLRCESGVLLIDILKLIVPYGWFLPVSPGTQYVTLGGAIANDVHGKNHHHAGTFGNYVRAFELLRSDGVRHLCNLQEKENSELFNATIGGLGLTGLITWAEIQLRSINSPMLDEQSIKFSNINEFFQISDDSDKDYEYTVAWIDCMARNNSLGRGIFSRANHSDKKYIQSKDLKSYKVDTGAKWNFPITLPFSLVNNFSVKLFNDYWYGKHRQNLKSFHRHFQSFFYPLDSVNNWNRIYGSAGMLQYQCVLPGSDGRKMLKNMLEVIALSGQGSFLAVAKIFGDQKSPGMLSFPRSGVTLALDFPNSPEVFKLLSRLDEMTTEVSGAVYPAKDSRMSSKSFNIFYPNWLEFSQYIDPRFSSSFWRRVTSGLI